VFVTGGLLFKRSGEKELASQKHESAEPYAWALAHDVRSAGQSLGARGCTDCHSSGAPLFDGKVASDAVLAGFTSATPMKELRNDDGQAALSMFALTYPMRPVLIFVGYVTAGILLLVLLNYALRGIGTVVRRK
jgi:hypothetical protein